MDERFSASVEAMATQVACALISSSADSLGELVAVDRVDDARAWARFVGELAAECALAAVKRLRDVAR